MIKTYFLATRPWSFPVSTMSVLVTAAGLYAMDFPVSWWLTAWATIGIVLFHAAENVLSDYYDYRKGVDRLDTFGSRTLVDGHLSPRQVLYFGWVLMLIASINGLWMVWVAGPQLLIYGGIGFLLAILYPWLKYHALGDVDILLEYGVLPALGTSFFVTGELHIAALWLVPAFATVTMGVLHANNTRDIASDKRANIVTLPMFIGLKSSAWLYYIMLCMPICWVTLCCLLGRFPLLCLILWLTLPLLLPNLRQMYRGLHDNQAINNLDEGTAKFQLINCIVLFLSLVLGHYFGI